jgi:hypothetical protein
VFNFLLILIQQKTKIITIINLKNNLAMKNQLAFALSFEKKTISIFESYGEENSKNFKMGKSWTDLCTEIF